MKTSNFDRLYRHTPANKLSADERNYTSWILRNSPESPCYTKFGIKDAAFFCGCALANIVCGRDIWQLDKMLYYYK